MQKKAAHGVRTSTPGLRASKRECVKGIGAPCRCTPPASMGNCAHVKLLSMTIESRRDIDLLEEAIRRLLSCQSSFCPVLQSDLYRRCRYELLSGQLREPITVDLGQCMQLRVQRRVAEVYDIGVLLPSEDSRAAAAAAEPQIDTSVPSEGSQRARPRSPTGLPLPPLRKQRRGAHGGGRANLGAAGRPGGRFL